MRAVIPNVPEWLLDDRARKGLDVFDEMWEGVLHMIPPPTHLHQWLAGSLLVAVHGRVQELGLLVSPETGLYRPGTDDSWRVPDLVIARPEHVSRRGVEGAAELVVELLSEGDETYAKLPFYGRVGVREVLVVEPETRRVELFLNEGGAMLLVPPDADDSARSRVLDLRFTTLPGPKLEVSGLGFDRVQL